MVPDDQEQRETDPKAENANLDERKLDSDDEEVMNEMEDEERVKMEIMLGMAP